MKKIRNGMIVNLAVFIVSIMLISTFISCSDNIDENEMVDFTVNLGSAKTLSPAGGLLSVEKYRVELYRLTTSATPVEEDTTFGAYYELAAGLYQRKVASVPTYFKEFTALANQSFRIPAGIYDIVAVGLTEEEKVVSYNVIANQKINSSTLAVGMALSPVPDPTDMSITFTKDSSLVDWTLVTSNATLTLVGGSTPISLTPANNVWTKADVASGTYLLSASYTLTPSSGSAITGTYYELVQMQYGGNTEGTRSLGLTGNSTFQLTDSTGAPISAGTVSVTIGDPPGTTSVTPISHTSFQNSNEIDYYLSSDYDDKLTLSLGASPVEGLTYNWTCIAEDGTVLSLTAVEEGVPQKKTFTPPQSGLYEVHVSVHKTSEGLVYEAGEIRFGIDAGNFLPVL